MYRTKIKLGICSYCHNEMLTMQINRDDLICGECNVQKVTDYRKEMKKTYDPFRYD